MLRQVFAARRYADVRHGPWLPLLGPVDHAGWVVEPRSPENQDFWGKTQEEGIAWWLNKLTVPRLGVEPFSRLTKERYREPC